MNMRKGTFKGTCGLRRPKSDCASQSDQGLRRPITVIHVENCTDKYQSNRSVRAVVCRLIWAFADRMCPKYISLR